MSDAISALRGARYDGLVTVRDAGVQGMVTLRGTLSEAPFQKALKAVMGCAVPEIRHRVTESTTSVLWMSPDELLITCDYGQADQIATDLAQALEGQHALAVNVSDARAVFRLSGAALRDVLAKLAPVDLSPEAFEVGHVRRTRLAQTAAAVWLTSETEATVVCFRSYGQYVFDLLCTVAHPASAVQYHSA